MTRKVPELDGIRGIAIVAVLMYHMSPQAVINKLPAGHWKTAATVLVYPISNLGWAGVDLFFVLSGFLITGILLETKASAHYFQNFYARRILRIFPIYYVALLLLLEVLPAIQPTLKATSVYHERAFFWVYMQNWLETFRGYTGFQSEFLGHTWSLAVEEQFYLFWPLAVYMLKARRLVATSVIFIVVSLLLRCIANVFAGSDFQAYNLVHFGLATRFDALALGALIACAARFKRRELDAYGRGISLNLAIAVLVASFGAILAVGPTEPQITNVLFRTVGYTVMAGIFALLLVKAIVAEATSPWRRLLRNPFLVYCGAISYGLYMYHWPVYYFLLKYMRRGPLKFAFPVVGLTLTFGLAYLSFRFFETPVLRLKRYFEGPRVGAVGDRTPIDVSGTEGI